MMRWRQTVGRGRALVGKRSAAGHFDGPAPVSTLGYTLFSGWVACAEPPRALVLELDGSLYPISNLVRREDVPVTGRLPHVTGWQVVVDVPRRRRAGGRTACLLVDGRTAAVASFVFRSPPPSGLAVAPDASSRRPEHGFYAAAEALPPGSRVLEVGTKQAVEGTSTHRQQAFPSVARSDYVMCDVLPGADVDVVEDLHHLPADWTGRFDAFLASAVFEHLERPWVAAKEVARILKPGGISLVVTHQCFPLHGYPSDFFRFSKEALSLIFADAGLDVVDAAYNGRATITAPPEFVPPAFHDRWNATWPSYLIVALFARKPAQSRT